LTKGVQPEGKFECREKIKIFAYKQDVRIWTGLILLRTETFVGCFMYDYEPIYSLRCA
jgi:hypothetical protein